MRTWLQLRDTTEGRDWGRGHGGGRRGWGQGTREGDMTVEGTHLGTGLGGHGWGYGWGDTAGHSCERGTYGVTASHGRKRDSIPLRSTRGGVV